MKKYILIFFMFFMGIPLFSQSLGKNKYWIPLTDKASNKYSILNPEEFLTERALQRRASQNIPVTEEDLPVNDLYVDSLSSLGLKVVGTSRWFNAVVVQSTDTLLLDTLSQLNFVMEFNPWEVIFTPLSIQERLPETKDETGGEDTELKYGKAGYQTFLLNGQSLHELGYKGKGMHIAVIDAGFYMADSLPVFNKLFESARLLGHKDFVQPGSDIYSLSSHGMSVLSTMAADLPGTMIGTAPEASYWLLRSEDAYSEYRVEEAYWVLAAEFADSVGVDIINTSLGYSNFYDSTMNYSHEDLDGNTALVTIAAEKASSKGILVVVSAGNEGNSEWQRITPPADAQHVLTVGGIDTSRNIAIFSSHGPTADGRIKPDVVAVGFRTTIINAVGNAVSGYGTSFASPQIAGLAACLWQAFPEKTNLEILQAIRRSANLYNDPDNIYGYGIPNFMLALWELNSDGSFGSKYPVVAFPNPFVDKLQLNFTGTESEIGQISIFSSAGKLVYSKTGKWQQGDFLNIENLQSFSPGMYFLVVHTKDNSLITKLIRQH